MNCPHCRSKNTQTLNPKTVLGYQQHRCCGCDKQFNERTGTPLNFIEYPTEVVMMVTHYYYRFKVSLEDVVELMLMRGFQISHQTVHNWVQTFGVELGMKLRTQRKGRAGLRWHADATYICIKGHWCYLYRAIDKEGNLVDVYLSDIRDQADHRGIKSRYKVMKGFKDIFCALIFCMAFEEIRQFFRMKDKTRSERRKMIATRIQKFNNLLAKTA